MPPNVTPLARMRRTVVMKLTPVPKASPQVLSLNSSPLYNTDAVALPSVLRVAGLIFWPPSICFEKATRG